MKGRSRGEAATGVGRIGGGQRETQRPFDFLEGHMLVGKRVV